MTNKQQTNMLIKDNGVPISTIRFSFMIPATEEVLIYKNFAEIAKKDPAYADLLSKEYKFCRDNLDSISEKAMKVYEIGCNPNHKLNYVCCKFKKLENHYMEFFDQEQPQEQ